MEIYHPLSSNISHGLSENIIHLVRWKHPICSYQEFECFIATLLEGTIHIPVLGSKGCSFQFLHGLAFSTLAKARMSMFSQITIWLVVSIIYFTLSHIWDYVDYITSSLGWNPNQICPVPESKGHFRGSPRSARKWAQNHGFLHFPLKKHHNHFHQKKSTATCK